MTVPFDSSCCEWHAIALVQPGLTCSSTGSAISANLVDSVKLPLWPDISKVVKEQKWVSEEYEHMWRRDGGGSTFLSSHGILSGFVML